MVTDRGDDLQRHLVRKRRTGGGPPLKPLHQAPLELGAAPGQGGLPHGLLGEVVPRLLWDVLVTEVGHVPVFPVLPDPLPDLVELRPPQSLANVGGPRVEGVVELLPFRGTLLPFGRRRGPDQPLPGFGLQPFLLAAPGCCAPVVRRNVGGGRNERRARRGGGLACLEIALPRGVDLPAGPGSRPQRRRGDLVAQLRGLEALLRQESVEILAYSVPGLGDLLQVGSTLVELPLDLGQRRGAVYGESAQQRFNDRGLLAVVPGRHPRIPLAVRPPCLRVLVEQPRGEDGLLGPALEPLSRLTRLLLNPPQLGRRVGGGGCRGTVGGGLLLEFVQPPLVPRPRQMVPVPGFLALLRPAIRAGTGPGTRRLGEGPRFLAPRGDGRLAREKTILTTRTLPTYEPSERGRAWCL